MTWWWHLKVIRWLQSCVKCNRKLRCTLYIVCNSVETFFEWILVGIIQERVFCTYSISFACCDAVQCLLLHKLVGDLGETVDSSCWDGDTELGETPTLALVSLRKKLAVAELLGVGLCVDQNNKKCAEGPTSSGQARSGQYLVHASFRSGFCVSVFPRPTMLHGMAHVLYYVLAHNDDSCS